MSSGGMALLVLYPLIMLSLLERFGTTLYSASITPTPTIHQLDSNSLGDDLDAPHRNHPSPSGHRLPDMGGPWRAKTPRFFLPVILMKSGEASSAPRVGHRPSFARAYGIIQAHPRQRTQDQ
ncbi:hypothetical protein B0H13DRAFT_1907984 [Mycena leptocephala]|nr:hypothetical protein B0H13DRAFT_1907984 [Mycena leptocephala]